MFCRTKDGTQIPYYEICDKEFKDMIRINRPDHIKSPILENYMDNMKETKTLTKFIPTELGELDVVLGGGLAPGVYIFGANPGIGKTSLMLHLIINLALRCKYILLFNLEMSTQQIVTKLLSNYSYRQSLVVNSKYKPFTINDLSSNEKCIQDGKFKENVYNLISSFNDNVYKYINVISKSEDTNMDTSKQSDFVECVDVALQNYKELMNVTPIIIIDFLQLLKLTPSKDAVQIDRRLEMNSIIEKLKKYSNIYQAPIILISSLSRRSYTNEVLDVENIEYNLSAFKESGMIEYQADFLAVLTKGKKIVNFGGKDKSQINISVLKTRYSPYADRTISLAFIPEYSYFEEISERKK